MYPQLPHNSDQLPKFESYFDTVHTLFINVGQSDVNVLHVHGLCILLK